jgi:Transcriptional regulatory protein, C terminal
VVAVLASPSDRGSAVVVIRWPEEAEQLESLPEDAPRLLLVAPDAAAPDQSDCVVDWIRLPASDADVRTRIAALEQRAARHATQPYADGHGRVFFRGRWVQVSPLEEALADVLAKRFGQVVDEATLVHAAWPHGGASRGALRIHMVRLRRRLGPLGLEIRNVRARGYVLQERQQRGVNG